MKKKEGYVCQPDNSISGSFDGKWTSSVGIRPAFYLPKDFFEKVSINIENTQNLSIVYGRIHMKQKYKTYGFS